jgi:hypothetical protein
LASSSYAVTLRSTPLERATEQRLGDLGVEVVADDLGSHLGGSSTLYDVIVVTGAATFAAVAPLVRAHQPFSALAFRARPGEPAVDGADAAVASLAPAGLDAFRRRGLAGQA